MNRCTLCPRECGVDRIDGQLGYCRTDASLPISSICCHMGEEPVLSGSQGICNVFFAHCNLQCIFCQNHQISSNQGSLNSVDMSIEEAVGQIETILKGGAHGVGFVSPSHCLTQMRAIMTALNNRGWNPTFVYNTNGYDRLQTIRSLEGVIDVYLPDMKYMDNELAHRYSGATDYVGVATKALNEMYRQKGAAIELDNDGYITSGLIIRHLVLPGHVENSIEVLRFIAEELSVDVHISLMAQYHPTAAVRGHEQLHRCLGVQEYNRVIDEFEVLGFYRGWVQDLSSSAHYLPDFDNHHPFEE
ncbi:MAG: radical SAM protein [candidate division Zixibacteria bacterium]|nr:radical SAM protein [candidate division Zixibacteria bacterium]MDH3939124.1 radical SAM protein [candidate division Zixibacteria bacterium]MDH4033325.1 radical SAM protein [candidate division Zixibacteria bacterium]